MIEVRGGDYFSQGKRAFEKIKIPFKPLLLVRRRKSTAFDRPKVSFKLQKQASKRAKKIKKAGH